MSIQPPAQSDQTRQDRQRRIAELIAQAAEARLNLRTAEQLRQQRIVDATAKDFARVRR